MAYDELRGDSLAIYSEEFFEPWTYFTGAHEPKSKVAVPGAGYNTSVPWTQCGSSDHKDRLALFERHIKASPKALTAVVTLTCPESVYAAQGLLANLENPVILMLQLCGNATNDTRLSSASTKEDTIDRFLFGQTTKETKDPNEEVAAVLKGGSNVATSMSISSTLEKFSSLRILGVSGVHLREGTVAWLSKLDQLYYLVLSGAGITSLPLQVPGAFNLIFLSFSDNHLTSIPAEWGGALHTVQSLSFGGNALTEFNLSSTPDLQWLDLRANRLAQMPAGLGEQFTLEVIDLSHNRITHFPASLGESCKTNAAVQQKLNNAAVQQKQGVGVGGEVRYNGWQTLRLQHNLIEQIPSSLSLCVDLLYLDLGDNLLTHLPDDLFSGDPSRLTNADCIANPDCTPEKEALSKLMYLRVDGNKLTTLGKLFEQTGSSFKQGDTVKALSQPRQGTIYPGLSKVEGVEYYQGRIQKVNGDGTFDIGFTHGEEMMNVPKSQILSAIKLFPCGDVGQFCLTTPKSDIISLRASRNRLTAIPLGLLLDVPNLKYVEERVAR